jgi:hypothetical protein
MVCIVSLISDLIPSITLYTASNLAILLYVLIYCNDLSIPQTALMQLQYWQIGTTAWAISMWNWCCVCLELVELMARRNHRTGLQQFTCEAFILGKGKQLSAFVVAPEDTCASALLELIYVDLLVCNNSMHGWQAISSGLLRWSFTPHVILIRRRFLTHICLWCCECCHGVTVTVRRGPRAIGVELEGLVILYGLTRD